MAQLAYKFSSSSEAMLKTLRPQLQLALREALATSKHDFGIVNPTGGYRSVEQQQKLFYDHKSGLDGLEAISYHQIGWAVDVFLAKDGDAIWKGVEFNELIIHIISVCAEHGLAVEWGGLWETRDNPHLQVVALAKDNRMILIDKNKVFYEMEGTTPGKVD